MTIALVAGICFLCCCWFCCSVYRLSFLVVRWCGCGIVAVVVIIGLRLWLISICCWCGDLGRVRLALWARRGFNFARCGAGMRHCGHVTVLFALAAAAAQDDGGKRRGVYTPSCSHCFSMVAGGAMSAAGDVLQDSVVQVVPRDLPQEGMASKLVDDIARLPAPPRAQFAVPSRNHALRFRMAFSKQALI